MKENVKEAIKEIIRKTNYYGCDTGIGKGHVSCLYILARHGIVNIVKGDWKYQPEVKE